MSILLFLSACWMPAAGLAQTLGAAIRGQIVDPAGAVLPGAPVAAINEKTGDARRTLSGSDGQFALFALPPGSYRLEAELPGFRKHVETGIDLQVGQDLRANITMQPGGPEEEVVVDAKKVLVEPDATGLGAVIGNRQIVSLPLDGRNFLQLSLLLPGTAPAAQGSPGSVRGKFAINVNGAREDANNFILDGAYNNDPKLNSFAINPPVDAIREFEILSSAYDATFGRSGGAQVNVVTKSGSNETHGTAYYFFRNAILDARNFFARSEDPAPRYQRNQFGFSLGGPVRKNRTFIFADYEGRRMREGITQVTNVPTALERDGDFSQSTPGHPVDPYTRSAFENGRIPPERISPVGRAIANLYPLPNRPTPGQNYVSSPLLQERDDRFDIRVDHSWSASSNLIARYSFSDRDLYEPFSGPVFALVPGFGAEAPRRAQNLMLGEDRVLSATLINQARFTFNRVAAGAFQERRGESLNRSVGLPELSPNPRDFGLSFITVSGYSPIGDEYNNPQHSVTNVFQLMDAFTCARGNHLFKLGVDFRSLQQNAFRDVQSRGFLTFSDFGRITGNGLADLLLGFITYSGGARIDNHQSLRAQSWNLFVQDSYRLHRNVTLQIGIRYEYNSPPVDRYDRASVYDPMTGSLVRVGTGGIPRGAYEPDRNNWAPRIGVAWTPGADGRSVVRAGYGIYFDQSSLAPGEGLYFNEPFYSLKFYFPLPGLPLTLDNPFPADYPLAIPGSALAFDRNIRTSYLQHWSFALQRQIGLNTLAEIAYVGSKGSKILSARDLNQAEPSPQQPNPRPVPQFADIIFQESRGNSSYSSIQLRFQQRFTTGFAALVSYTFGKSLDETSTFFSSSGDANFPQDSANLGAERGRSNFDVRHRLSLGYSWDIPIGAGRRVPLNNGLTGALLGNWSMHGIVTLQSGRPFTVALRPEIDNSNTGIASLGFGANDRPNRTASGRLAQPRPERWFDTSAFVMPDYGSFGDSGRNILNGPPYWDWSVALIKDSPVSEGLNLQFRAELFNSLNRPNFDLPDIFLGSPSFGRILSARNPRRIQFGLKLIF